MLKYGIKICLHDSTNSRQGGAEVQRHSPWIIDSLKLHFLQPRHVATRSNLLSSTTPAHCLNSEPALEHHSFMISTSPKGKVRVFG